LLITTALDSLWHRGCGAVEWLPSGATFVMQNCLKDHVSAGHFFQIILHVRFAAHNGLNSNIAACPKTSTLPNSCTAANSSNVRCIHMPMEGLSTAPITDYSLSSDYAG
jgi:hypothetical protein